jgi:hypothetical protein
MRSAEARSTKPSASWPTKRRFSPTGKRRPGSPGGGGGGLRRLRGKGHRLASDDEGRSNPPGSRDRPAELFTEVGLTPSRGEAKRLIAQGGLSVNDERIGSLTRTLTIIDVGPTA